MALKLSTIADGTIEVIARIDSSLPADLTDDEYNKYLENLDETILRISGDDKPTRFVMRRVLPYALAQKVANKQLKLIEGNLQPQLGYMTEEVRCALVSIKNPDTVPADEQLKFERASDHGASEDLIARLMSCGVVMNLYHARTNALQNKSKSDPKKS
jgi:hypothetical protein